LRIQNTVANEVMAQKKALLQCSLEKMLVQRASIHTWRARVIFCISLW
jgi:hypothetical protein